MTEGWTEENLDERPAPQVRFSLSQTLMDLSMHEQAVKLLAPLLEEEDDENPHVWHMLAQAHMLQAEFEDAEECAENFKACGGPAAKEAYVALLKEMEQCKKAVATQGGCTDASMS